jgi:choice-of-anchor A domain-containing protein
LRAFGVVMRKLSFGIAALLSTALVAPANATSTLTADQYKKATRAIQVMQSINLLTFGDTTLHSDVEGKVYVGGNLNGNGAPVAIGNSSKGYKADSRMRSLTVGGDATNVQVNNGIGLGNIEAVVAGTATNVQVNNNNAVATLTVGGDFHAQNFNPNNKKTVKYGGTVSGTQTQDAAYVKKDATLSTAALKAGIAAVTENVRTEMTTLSSILGALTPTATLISSDQNNIHFNFTAAATSSNYAVANITASQLANGTFFLPNYATSTNGKTLIINVSGSAVTFGANMTNGNYQNLQSLVQQNIIWNFTDATTINVNTAVYGSILAPKATISGNSPINGSVVAQVFQSNGEVHLGTFNGNTGFLVAPPPSHGGGGGHVTPAVPEPSSWMTMLTGFAFIGSIIRRQRRKERLAAA